MPDPLTNKVRRDRIVEVAWILWNDFLIYSENIHSAQALLDPAHFLEKAPGISQRNAPYDADLPRYPRNNCAVAFFKYCAEIFTGATADVVNYRLDVGVPPRTGRATSWLWNIPPSENENYAVVVIDADYIATVHPELPKIWTRLLVHEIGHLVLHWDLLDAQRRAGRVPEATSEQEAEAWWFCAAIMGFSVANYAMSSTGNPASNHDEAWRFAC